MSQTLSASASTIIHSDMGHICSAIFLFLDKICSSSYRDHLKELIKHGKKKKECISSSILFYSITDVSEIGKRKKVPKNYSEKHTGRANASAVFALP